MNRAYAVVGLGIAIAWAGLVAIAGPLNPPAGPVSPTSKTLQEVYDKVGAADPRTPISAATTPGDSTSLFKITGPGSYYLTGNITGVAAKHGIALPFGVTNVTIDLNGFALTGVPGSLDGISSTGSNTGIITIRNGSIRNWGGSGIDLVTNISSASRITNISASFNSARGIAIFAGNINDCVADNNATGIYAAFGAVISNCTTTANTADGIAIGEGGTATACTCFGNGGNGISAVSRTLIGNCNASYNILDAIRVTSRCSVLSSLCATSGLGAPNNGAGIHVLGDDNRIEGNNCVQSVYGVRVEGSGSIIVRNTCSGNSTANWAILANNIYGPIIDRSALGTPAVTGNASAGTLGSSEPNANFTY